MWGKIKRKFGNMLKEKTLNSLLLTAFLNCDAKVRTFFKSTKFFRHFFQKTFVFLFLACCLHIKYVVKCGIWAFYYFVKCNIFGR